MTAKKTNHIPYHLRLKHKLSLIDIEWDISGYASILDIDALPVAAFADLAELDAG